MEVGPRIVSNQTDYPLIFYGEGFEPGMTAAIIGNKRTMLPTVFIDSKRLGAILPAKAETNFGRDVFDAQVLLIGADGKELEGRAGLSIVDDASFNRPERLVLSKDEKRAFVSSRTTDEVFSIDLESGAVESLSVGDGPSGLALLGEELWVAYEFERKLGRLFEKAEIEVSTPIENVIADENRFYASSRKDDVLLIVEPGASKIEKVPVGVNPGPLAWAGDFVIVGNSDSEDLSIVERATKKERRVRFQKGIEMIGGHTAKYADYVMGGKPARDIAYSSKHGRAFVASLGPNVGPNPDRMEVTMNGGIGVLDVQNASFIRHVSLEKGLPQALAIDDVHDLLYAADLSTGRIVILSQTALIGTKEEAQKAIVGEFLLPIPEKMPRIRPESDFGVNGRSTVSLHAGPTALALSRAKDRLFVLNRFSRELVELDVSGAKNGRVVLKKQIGLPGPKGSEKRLLGEVLYFTDLGNSRMSCDTCHPSGHNGGLLFTKGAPIQIYRSPSIRASRETPPYFTPSQLRSLKEMSTQVLARNRYYNPKPTDEEIDALTHYSTLITEPPNPYRTKSGDLPETIELPDGEKGNAKRGLALFDGKAGCSERYCHPAPHFTSDQHSQTRGQNFYVGTPWALSLRPELQDLARPVALPPPALLGAWDRFPLLMSGAAGFEVEGELVVPTEPFALRRVLEFSKDVPHGNNLGLTQEEKNDLLAYLLTL